MVTASFSASARRLVPALLPLLAAVALSGCSPRDGRQDVHERLVMQCDFESFTSMLPDSLLPSLTQRQAHSGRYAISVDSAHEYALSYNVLLSRIFRQRPRKLRVSAWTWATDYKADALLVVAISASGDPNRSVFRETYHLSTFPPYREWKPVTIDVDMPPDAYSDSQLSIYLWRASAEQPVYLDDVRLTEIR